MSDDCRHAFVVFNDKYKLNGKFDSEKYVSLLILNKEDWGDNVSKSLSAFRDNYRR